MSRFRERDGRFLVPFIVKDVPGNTTAYSPTTAGTHETIQDVVTPNFKERIRRGEIVMNPITRATSTLTNANSVVTFGPHPLWGTRIVEGDIAAKLGSANQLELDKFAEDIPNMRVNALVKAYAKIDESAIMGMVNIKEIGQTVGMLTKPFNSALKLMKKIIKRKDKLIRSGCKGTKAYSDAWLEYRYGWQPIMIDAESIIERTQQNKLVSAQGQRYVARAGTEGPDRSFRVRGESGSCPGIPRATFTRGLNTQTRVYAGVIYRVVDENAARSLEASLGLRLQDVPLALWESMPLSFVFDWWVDVGSWLQAVTPKPNIRYLGNWVTEVTEQVHYITDIVCELTVGPIYPYSSVTYKCDAMGGSNHAFLYRRYTNQSLPLTPVANTASSLLHQIDGLALLSSRLITGLDSLYRR